MSEERSFVIVQVISNAARSARGYSAFVCARAQPDFYQVVTDAPAEGAWPIASCSFWFK
ncbi:hypothetical protein [Caballeronia sp. BR00000012568055]|uniref:hypothetical protein n=1 Tax=Caballeronia sp. BR00000012568055 TaxID=2918761 RepID=UPI0023F87CB6|nr:hypothetical protein [Caballeronia sp. BR00000012568055]